MLPLRLALLLALSVPLSATATVFTGSFQADTAGAQAAGTCALISPSEAPGTVSFDTSTRVFSWSYTFGDNAPDFDNGQLLSPQLAAHFHLNEAPFFPIEIVADVGTPETGSAVLTPEQSADLLAGRWFINIHSQPSCPAGEIQGSITMNATVPWPPFAVPVLGGGLLLSTLWVARRDAR